MLHRSNKTRFGRPLPKGATSCQRNAPLMEEPLFLQMPIRRPHISGLTLLEVLLALSVVAMVAVALLGLSRAVAIGSAYSEGIGLTTQHARVLLERMTRTVREATANANFPGFIVVPDQVGSWRFPDTLVVWHPESAPADSTGWPLFSELVIYCPHPQEPGWLMEIRVPEDTRPVPTLASLGVWQAELASIKASAAATAVRLTDRVRICTAPELGNSIQRGAVRFEARYRPSLDEWTAYKAGTTAWNALTWPQSLYGPNTGLRQAWLRIEVQLVTGQHSPEQAGYPFFGSAALYYPLSP